MPNKTVRQTVMQMPRIDTHGHQHLDLRSLESAAVAPEKLAALEAPYNARSIAEGCRVLYGTDVGPVLRTDAPRSVFEQAATLRSGGCNAAYSHAYKVSGIERQFCFCDFRGTNAKAKRAFAPHIHLLAYIDRAVLGAPEKNESYFSGLERLHGRLSSLDQLLEIIDRSVASWRALGVVGMKVSLAYYDRGLNLRLADRATAEAAFARKENMSTEERRIVRDFALLHAFDVCARESLPIVIHTGFLAGKHETLLTDTNPVHMEPVFWNPRYKDAVFVLLHGAYPYTGETGYLVARHANVVLDFTWISWFCPARFRQALGEWLALAPLNRFVWGSDSGPLPESIAGTDALSRRAIAQVLDDQIDAGVLDEARALSFVEQAFRENARRIFRLDDLGLLKSSSWPKEQGL